MAISQKLLNALEDYKKPQSEDNHIGIELEFSSPIPLDDLKKELINMELDEYCTLHNDGGEWDDEENIELAFLIPQKGMKEKFLKLGKMLSELGCKFHPDSGFHVHLDMRRRNPAKAFLNLVHTQPILFAIADSVRKRGEGSRWCKRVKHTALGGHGNDGDDEYYGGGYYDHDSKEQAISPHLTDTKNTIEVRIRESCVDGLEIYNWVRLLCSIVDAPFITEKVSTIKEIEKNVSLAESISEYIRTKARANKQRNVLK